MVLHDIFKFGKIMLKKSILKFPTSKKSARKIKNSTLSTLYKSVT